MSTNKINNFDLEPFLSVSSDDDLYKLLSKFQDLNYQNFTAKLVPNIDKNTIIGIRFPLLKKIAKVFSKNHYSKTFMNNLPHQYFEFNILHAYLLDLDDDVDLFFLNVDKFLPYIDNWAVCDIYSFPIIKKFPKKTYDNVKNWIHSSHIYTQRFAIGILLRYFLDAELFLPEMLDLVAAIKSEEYYLNMMIAWYFSVALVKQYDLAICLLKEKRFSKWVHNKTIQKAIESFRVSLETKAYLKTLKIK
ncbi:Uncharacterised protein [Metamycoplasma arthritidis]|uniref:DNA alkylation repair enzyme n=1 Tax=Metamycoplasma arthritidis (strain 158L3-1) TaxID=243272 RepID=B3PLY0_META1|nr:DNA alkylation repair protein [Metamycoplasma arthritidis]ACF07032.1 conserved hypothetical protein, possible DNA alkylation repair enzyme [Metamycoplasma arthritidis 158L3-1]VEU78560.1 Uncharacterised protein [Metamycoplasma arthritidis]